MKSFYHGTACANAKLRGKKFASMICGCCVMINIKDEIKEKAADKEIKEFNNNAPVAEW